MQNQSKMNTNQVRRRQNRGKQNQQKSNQEKCRGEDNTNRGMQNQQQKKSNQEKCRGEVNNSNTFLPTFRMPLLIVKQLHGPGREIKRRDLFYTFNLVTRDPDDPLEKLDKVRDIYIPNSEFALVLMNSDEAAKRAIHELDCSWVFDKYIRVHFANKIYKWIFPRRRPLRELYLREPNQQQNKGKKPTDNDLEDDNYEEEETSFDIGYYATNLPSRLTRHLRPGSISGNNTDNWNLKFLHRYKRQQKKMRECPKEAGHSGDKDQTSSLDEFREVTRERGIPSPVLHVNGLELGKCIGNKVLTRTDLLTLFSFYGDIVDIQVGYWNHTATPDQPVKQQVKKHQAFIQMRTVEQATEAMHKLDHRWQMGRYLKVTYANTQSIEFSKEQIRGRQLQQRSNHVSRLRLD